MALITGSAIGGAAAGIDKITGGKVGGAIGDIGGTIGGAVKDLFGSGVDRAGTRGEVQGPLFSLARKVQQGKVRVTGPVKLQLEYYGKASDKSDSSKRAEIFQSFRSLSSYRSGSDSGYVHNNVVLGPDGLLQAQRIAQRFDDLKVYVKNAPMEKVQQDRSRSGGGSTPPGGGQVGGGNGGGSTQPRPGGQGGQRAGLLQNVGTLPLLLVAGFVGYLISQQ